MRLKYSRQAIEGAIRFFAVSLVISVTACAAPQPAAVAPQIPSEPAADITGELPAVAVG